MKLTWLGLLSIVGASSAFALPDAVVSGFSHRAPVVLSDGRVAVTVQVTIQNQGHDLLGRIKISAEGRGNPVAPTHFHSLPLQVISGATPEGTWYAWTPRALRTAESLTFSARILFPRDWRGRRVTIRTLADSCAGEEFVEPYCRVPETNEGNNFSRMLGFTLP